ncbi:helix-turn-helix domain-containing protein [Gymnodinialimonas sp. 2305UL16-5]|uniref:helix-turn-helix domain-containing protein n=1 Tax=Gymnodinialimonas mytili TaxID=3126503 RepID=UPI0030A33EEF
MAEKTRVDLTGSRIRERRLARQMAQGALAKIVGISPSYLNLIEHNHRKIGGALLLSLARALEVEPAVLTEGVEAGLGDLVRAAAQSTAPQPPEMERIDELAARFPGWTSLIAAQQQRCARLEGQIDALRDRLAHDTDLSEAMHGVLSSVAAIRSTADILAREADLDPAWLARFHRNLHEEAERLSAQATGLLGQFELPDRRSGEASALAVEAVEAFFDVVDHHFPAIEVEGAAAIEGVIDAAGGLETDAARELARAWLTAYANDAARLPLAAFAEAAEAANYDPLALLGFGGGDVALVLRRLAQIPLPAGMAPFGLAIADASGGLLFRRRSPGFTLPRYGVACPRWPLYRAFARPGQPDVSLLEVTGRARLRSWSVAQLVLEEGSPLTVAPPMRATMLVQGAEAGAEPALDVGPDCPECRATPHITRG